MWELLFALLFVAGVIAVGLGALWLSSRPRRNSKS
jgi:ABC-type transporter Mla subunit MlaD